MGRSQAKRFSKAMERSIANFCACLNGKVDLKPSEDLTDQFSVSNPLPIPWIAVTFHDEVDENASQNEDINELFKDIVIISRIENSSDKGSRRNRILNNIQDKLVAIRSLSLLASHPEYSWRGNPNFWMHVLKNVCNAPYCNKYMLLSRDQRSRSFWEPARDADGVHGMIKFRLMFTHSNIKNDSLSLCAQVLSSTRNEVIEPVDQQVENLLARLNLVSRVQSQNVDIDLDFSRSKLRVGDSIIGVQALLEALNGRKEAMTSTGVFFKVKSLNLSETTICDRDLAPLARIIALPELLLRELHMNLVFNARTSKRFMRGFSEFTAACFATLLARRVRTTPLTKLCLNFNAMSAFQLASLFSAIREGSSQCGVRDLSLCGFEGSDAWLWLAFGMFFPNSKSRIVHLDLSNCVLRLEDIERVRNFLNSSDYASCLMQTINARPSSQALRDSKKQWALLPTGTCLEIPRKTKKPSKGKLGPALKLDDDLWCEVLEKGAMWTCVLVPAYGMLYVKNTKIMKAKTEIETQPLKRPLKLESLAMAAVITRFPVLRVGDNGELRGSLSSPSVGHIVSEWIQIVGRSLRTLQLNSNSLTNRELIIILVACPVLQHLDISDCELKDISAVANAFRYGNCILQTLKASHNQISAQSQEVLFRLLGNQECDAVRKLQVLHLDDNPTSSENRILKVLRSSLRRNNTLRYLALTANEKHRLVQYQKDRFEAQYHGQWLGCEGPSFKNRLALLSVEVVKMLPIDIVQIVLGYAGKHIYRQVRWQ